MRFSICIWLSISRSSLGKEKRTFGVTGSGIRYYQIMPEQRVLKLQSQLNAVLSELIVKGDLVKLNWPICVIRELSLCCRLSVLLKISRGFATKRPLLGLLLGGMGLNLRLQSKNYSSIGHLLTIKVEYIIIHSNSMGLLV